MYFKQFIRLFVRATYLLFGEPVIVDKKRGSRYKCKVVVFITEKNPVSLSFVGHYLTEMICFCWVVLIKLSTLEKAACSIKNMMQGGCLLDAEVSTHLGLMHENDHLSSAVLAYGILSTCVHLRWQRVPDSVRPWHLALHLTPCHSKKYQILFTISWNSQSLDLLLSIYWSLSWLSSDIWSS